jgi:hypothetical protein
MKPLFALLLDRFLVFLAPIILTLTIKAVTSRTMSAAMVGTYDKSEYLI